MATESELTSKINQLQRSYVDARNKNEVSQEKIEELESALRHVRQAMKSVESLRRSLGSMDVSSRWKGKRRNGFDQAREGDLLQGVQKYGRGIDDLERAIKNEIRELENGQNKLVKLLTSIEKQIGTARREKAKLQSDT